MKEQENTKKQKVKELNKPLNKGLFFNRIEKWYCISINEDRKKEVKKIEKLIGKNFDYSIFEDGNKKTIKQYLDENLIHKDWYKNRPSMTLNMVGCTLSFGKIYQDIVDNGYGYSIIFEDDIVWNSGKYGNVENIKETLIEELEKIKEISDDWDIFYLGSESQGPHSVIQDNIVQFNFTDKSKLKGDPLIAQKRFTSEYNQPPCRSFGGNHALIVTLNGAKEILKLHYPAICISDGIVATTILTGSLKHYSFRPSLFKQKDKQHYE